jgi:hypothetical protein
VSGNRPAEALGMRLTCIRLLSSAPRLLIGSWPVVACVNESYR